MTKRRDRRWSFNFKDLGEGWTSDLDEESMYVLYCIGKKYITHSQKTCLVGGLRKRMTHNVNNIL